MSNIPLQTLDGNIGGFPQSEEAAAFFARSEENYRQLMQGLPAAIYVCDSQGRIKLFNEAAVELWGRRPKVGVDLWCGSLRVFSPDGAPVPLDSCPMAIALREGREVSGWEIVVERPDGTRRNVLPFPQPIRDSSGKVVGAVNMLVDIAERQTAAREISHLKDQRMTALAARIKAEESLRERENQLRTIMSNMPAAVFTCAPDGRITFFNERAVELWGRKPNVDSPDDRYCGFFAFYLPDGTPVATELSPVRIALREGKSFQNVEGILERKNHTKFAASVSITPIRNENGNVTGVINVFHDITEIKAAQSALQKAKDTAEAANRSKDRFLAVLSHELRTPLTPVAMAAAAMKNHPELPPQLREEVEMIRRNVDLETKLIDDLLDLSRIISGKLRLHVEPLDLNEIVKHVCRICRGQILEKHIRLHCELDSDVQMVSADSARLQQVLWNVLKNAAKFTPDGGNIYVTTEHVSGKVHILIRDTGIGIPANALPHIFDAFEQGDGSITRQFGGLGLGLAISKALTELHRGKISVESDGVGKGSTFTIELPAWAPPMDNPEIKTDSAPDVKPAPLKLLVVEDHPDTARMLGKLLGSAGYTVRTATDAAGALELASKERFDLLVSDIGLPDATGYHLMEQIKQQHGTIGIAMSGYGMDEDIRKSQEAGFSDHLVKPISFAQLEQAIQRLARSGT